MRTDGDEAIAGAFYERRHTGGHRFVEVVGVEAIQRLERGFANLFGKLNVLFLAEVVGRSVAGRPVAAM